MQSHVGVAGPEHKHGEVPKSAVQSKLNLAPVGPSDLANLQSFSAFPLGHGRNEQAVPLPSLLWVRGLLAEVGKFSGEGTSGVIQDSWKLLKAEGKWLYRKVGR